ncbi:phosphotransferase enzyme family protein [Chitinophaga varians]|uniref:phosphotransferase enzyme family protein n=1 Tax=Chitinophaga varians TaxID=2202339 RepID=UPI00165F294C|nr:phosphotransferase [Chitinophaga varians]MBC9910145.1 phosphotransferase [Chitinophaga varians]
MKTVFPATYSTLCPDALSSFLSEKYALGHVQCKLLVRGVGDTYLAETADNRFILRVYRSSHRSLSQIKEEVTLLLALKAAAVSVSWPIPDVSGENIQLLDAVEGERCAVLFSYAQGQAVRLPNEDQLRLLGNEMARFHNVSSAIDLGKDRWTFNSDTMFVRPLEMLKPAFAGSPEDYTWLQQAVGEAVKKLSLVNGLSMGYCHFDFLPKNMHFGESTVTLFDFDFMGYGWLANDLASFWQYLALEVYTKRMTQQVADEQFDILLNAYRQHRSLDSRELEVLPYLAVGWWLFYMGFHTTHDQFHAYTQPGQVKLFTGLLRHLATTYWK